MSKSISTLVALAFATAITSHPVHGLSQQQTPAPAPGTGVTKTFTFESDQELANWKTTGKVTIDPTKGRDGKSGALKVEPGAKALLKLRDKDESGQVEFWVYDDGTIPKNPKVSRVGPRWGLV